MTVITGQILRLMVKAPTQPKLSVAVTANAIPVVPLVAVVGVPEITPVEAVRVNPAGRLAEVIAKVYGLVPPLAVTVAL